MPWRSRRIRVAASRCCCSIARCASDRSALFRSCCCSDASTCVYVSASASHPSPPPPAPPPAPGTPGTIAPGAPPAPPAPPPPPSSFGRSSGGVTPGNWNGVEKPDPCADIGAALPPSGGGTAPPAPLTPPPPPPIITPPAALSDDEEQDRPPSDGGYDEAHRWIRKLGRPDDVAML